MTQANDLQTPADIPKNVDEYIARYRAAVASNPDCGNSHYNLAVGLLGQRKFGEAEQEFHKAIDCSPTLAEAYVQLGGIALQRGDLDACLDFNKRATQCRAGFAEGFANIGFIHIQKGEAEEAIRVLKKAIQYNPRFVQAFATLANAYLMSGLVDESIEANKKVLELQPDFAVAHNNLAIAYLERGDADLAVEHFDQAKSLGYAVAPEIEREIEALR